MNNVARLRTEAIEEAGLHLGPAEITSCGPVEIEARVRKTGAVVRVRVALAHAYEPNVGDEVLVIGGPDGHWIIGVLTSTGRAVVSFPGDAEVRAGGVLKLAGAKGVEIAAPRVELRASRLEAVASEVVHTFKSLRQRVSEIMSTHAGQAHTVVEGSMHTQAKSASILTEETVSINGKSVHLG